MRIVLAVIVFCSLLLAGCSGGPDQSVQGQVRSGQGVLMVLQNQGDLDHLYMMYDGPTTDAPSSTVPSGYQDSEARNRAQSAYNDVINSGGTVSDANAAYYAQLQGSFASGQATNAIQIGELNLLLHNIGASATVGGLFVSGYDPKLISVESKLGQRPINRGTDQGGGCFSNTRDCYKAINVQGTGNYEVTYFCEPIANNIGCSVDVWNSGDSTNIVGGLYGVNVGSVLDKIGGIFGSDTSFADDNLFKDNPINVFPGVVDGKPVLKLQFSNPYSFDVNRASHGYLLINLFYADFAGSGCPNNCRVFPDRAPGDVLHGVSLEYPQGDVMYADYDIYLDRDQWNPLINEVKQTFQITACYLYTTVVTPTVCVDPVPQNNVNDACNPNTPIVFKENQGAPIKVSRIESKAVPGAMQFTIYVEKVDKSGQVWLPGSLDQCSPYTPGALNRRRLDAVQLIDARVSGEFMQMTCLPTTNSERIVRLENGRGQITCVYPMRAGYTTPTTAFQTSLALEFGYLYQNTIKKEVIVHRT